MGKGDAAKNKEVFDMLFSHRDEIEQELGVALEWERANEYKASWISYCLPKVSVVRENDWSCMAEFHAEWSDKMCNAILPYLQ